MTFEKEIHAALGIQFRRVPDDGKLRRFKIGATQEGFAILFPSCGAFGNWSAEDYWAWDGAKAIKFDRPAKPKRLTQGELKKEQQIVAIGNAASDAGNPLQGEDMDRYILALTRVIDEKSRNAGAKG